MELNDEKAMELIRTVVVSLPDHAIDGIVFLEYVNATDSPTFGGFLMDNGFTDCRSIVIDATGGLYIIVVSKSVEGGFEYDMKVHGEIDADGIAVLEGIDASNPDKELYYRNGVKGSVDARIILKTDRYLVPQEVSVTSEISLGFSYSNNYIVEYPETGDGSGVHEEYSFTGDRTSNESVDAEICAFVGIDGLTKDEVKALFGSSSEEMKKRVTVVQNSFFEDIDGHVSLSGVEFEGIVDLVRIVGDSVGEVDVDDRIIPTTNEEFYFLMQKILAETGVFVSEQDYRTIIGALKDVKESLRSGVLNYFYETDKGRYNSSAGLVDEIGDKVKDCPDSHVNRISTGDRYLEYSKRYLDKLVTVTDYSGGSSIPDAIRGYPVLKGQTDDGIYANIWFDSNNHENVRFRYLNANQYTAEISGEMPDGIEAFVGDGSDKDLNGLVSISMKESSRFITWYLQIDIIDSYRLVGKTLTISSGTDIWSIDFTLEYGDLFVSDDLFYILYEHSASAEVVGVKSGSDSVSVPSSLDVDGETYDVKYVRLRGVNLGRLSVESTIWLYLPGCSIDEIVISMTDRYQWIDLSFIDGMEDLGGLTIDGKSPSTYGTVAKDGWKGPGRIIHTSVDGIRFLLNYKDGELVAFMEINGTDVLDVEVPTEISVDGETIRVFGAEIRESSIQTLTIGDVTSILLSDSSIDTMILSKNDYRWTYTTFTIRSLVFNNMEEIIINCNRIAAIDGLESLQVNGPVEWNGDIQKIRGLLTAGKSMVTIGNIEYLKDDKSRTLQFLGVAGNDITVYGKIGIDGTEYTVMHFSLYGVRTIKNVHVESMPSGGIDFTLSSVENLIFDNDEPISLPDHSVQSCDKLKSVVFNGPVDVIGSDSFVSSTEIRNVTFNSSVGTIERSAFLAIGGITSLEFKDSVGAIEENAFGGLNKLRTVMFGGNVGTIHRDAFIECSSLESMTFEKNVGELNGSSDCGSFSNLVLKGDVDIIPESAFQYVSYTIYGVLKPFSIEFGEGSRISSIEQRAFSHIYLSEDTISSLLERSTFVSITAFDDVITGYDGGNKVRYIGISSGRSSFECSESDVHYYYNMYVEDGRLSVNIVGISASGKVTVPKELTIDGVSYPVVSLMEGYRLSSEDSITGLVVGANIKHIGSNISYAFPELETIEFQDNNGFGTYRVESSGSSLQILYRCFDDAKEYICSFGSVETEVFEIPSGFDEFELDWLNDSRIDKLVVGDGVTRLILDSDRIEGLKTIEIGMNVVSISFNGSRNDYGFTVDRGNTSFICKDGALYKISDSENRHATLIYFPSDKTGDAVIPDTIEEFTVTEIGLSAFRYSGLSKLTLPGTVTRLHMSCFMYSDIEEIIVSDGLTYLIGGYGYDTDPNGDPIIPLRNIHSTDGKTVFTEDGAIYFNSSRGLVLADYLGSGSILIVKEGTVESNIYDVGAKSLTRIILPQETKSLDIEHYNYSSDSPIIYVLIPKDSYLNIHGNNACVLARTYSTSGYYDLSFAEGDDGLVIDAVADHATVTDVRIGGYKVAGNTIPWNTLFPSRTAEMTGSVYEDSIEISYVVDQFKVVFDTGFEGTVIEKVVGYGDRVEVPTDPISANMSFAGWYTDAECTDPFRYYEPITSDLTLYAKWETKISAVEVHLCEGLDGIIIDEYWCWDGSERPIPFGTYVVEYRFENGYTGVPVIFVNGEKAGTTVTINDDRTVIEVTGIQKERYSVEFVNNVSRGSADTSLVTVEYGDSFELPDVVPKEGYEFVGWTDGFMIVHPGYRVVGDTTLTAAYVRSSTNDYYQDEFTIILDIPSNGTLAGAHILKGDKGDVITLPIVTVASGFRFDGWVVDGKTVTGGYMVLGDVTLTASIRSVLDPPSTPTQPDRPDVPDKDVKENDDGSVTVTVRNDDGSTTSTTTKKESDGTTVVKEENKDRNGNVTSTSTTTTSKDGSLTKVEESKTENGSVMKEERFDRNGNSQGTTTRVTETVTTDSGATMETNTVTTADGSGKKMDEIVSVKAESDDGKITTEAVVEKRSDGSSGSSATTIVNSDSTDGTIHVSDSDVDAALRQMDEVVSATGYVERKVIEIGTTVRTDITEASISSESMRNISDSGADVRIAGDSGTIVMGTDVSKNLSEKSVSGSGTVSVSIGKADKTAMSSSQRSVVGDRPVFQLRASVGNESIHELGGTVTVTVPYVLAPGEDPELVRVYYVDDEGSLHMNVSRYDPKTGTVSFETDHFSFFMIGHAAAGGSDDEKNDHTAAIVAVVAVAIIAAIVVKVCLANRKH